MVRPFVDAVPGGGAGGGGGWYGGYASSGGWGASSGQSAAGGGSGYINPILSSASTENGVREGNGLVKITLVSYEI